MKRVEVEEIDNSIERDEISGTKYVRLYGWLKGPGFAIYIYV